ncbi:hypothetical protein ACFOSW_16940 [Paenibacillus sp. GCM10012303]
MFTILLSQGLLVNINDDLLEELFSDAAYDIAKRHISHHSSIPAVETQGRVASETEWAKITEIPYTKATDSGQSLKAPLNKDIPSRCFSKLSPKAYRHSAAFV